MLRAALALRRPGDGAALRLTKSLPVAAGIGGGSADAAAALRLLARLWQAPLPGPDALLRLGADLPVCLAGRSCRMRGIGETPRAARAAALLAGARQPRRAARHRRGLRRPRPPRRTRRSPRRRPCPTPQRSPPSSPPSATTSKPPAAALAPPVAEALRRARAPSPAAGSRGCRAPAPPASASSPPSPEALAAAAALSRARPGWWVAAAPVG